jgi:N-carbamoylputrescine amidase
MRALCLADREEMLVAEVNLSDARRRRDWTDFNQVLREYDEMLGAEVKRGWS